MIAGIGCDIVEVARIERLIREYGQHFLDRLFTAQEQSYCSTHRHQAEHYAGRFAAKESIAKALGTGIGAQLSWQDIEILKDERGKPVVNFSEKARELFKQPEVLLSISHCSEYAVAYAVWQVTSIKDSNDLAKS